MIYYTMWWLYCFVLRRIILQGIVLFHIVSYYIWYSVTLHYIVWDCLKGKGETLCILRYKCFLSSNSSLLCVRFLFQLSTTVCFLPSPLSLPYHPVSSPLMLWTPISSHLLSYSSILSSLLFSSALFRASNRSNGRRCN